MLKVELFGDAMAYFLTTITAKFTRKIEEPTSDCQLSYSALALY